MDSPPVLSWVLLLSELHIKAEYICLWFNDIAQNSFILSSTCIISVIHSLYGCIVVHRMNVPTEVVSRFLYHIQCYCELLQCLVPTCKNFSRAVFLRIISRSLRGQSIFIRILSIIILFLSFLSQASSKVFQGLHGRWWCHCFDSW